MIFVMKDRRLAERGTHDELRAAGGFNSELPAIRFAARALVAGAL